MEGRGLPPRRHARPAGGWVRMTKPRGNPAKRQRGEVVRAVIVALLAWRATPLDAVTEVCDISRGIVAAPGHAARRAARSGGLYTTASMMVRV